MAARRILVVDDDPPFRKLIRSVVEACGDSLLEAGTGEDAKRLMRSPGADLVIVDGLLPDGDGVIWVSWLRKVGFTTPVIFVSAQARDSVQFARLIRELQVGLVLRKPVMLPVLGEQIERLLHATSVPEAAVEVKDDLEAALEPLRKEYARALPARVGELGAAVTALRLNEEGLPLARTLAHRIRGTAGTYGFSEVSESAGRIEDDLVDIEQGRLPIAALWSSLNDALDACARLAGIAESGPPKMWMSRATIALSPSSRSSIAGETLLVVDDDEQLLTFLKALGQSHSIGVVTARNATDALRTAAYALPDAILLDVNLGADGQSFKLPFQLRSLPGLAGLPVGFMSTDRQAPNRAAAAYAGASVFLSKPIDPVAFGVAARQLLALRKGVRSTVVVGSASSAVLESTQALLEQLGVQIIPVASALEIERVVGERGPDLLLLDTALPELSPFDICRAFRMDPITHDLPIVFLSTTASREGRSTAFRAGADDILPVPLIEDEFLARARMLMERHRLRRDLAVTDALTGLRTRTSFLSQVVRELESMQRAGKPLAFALFDIDGFTAFNETYGSEAGDRVLGSLGRIIRNSLFSDVLRGRWSGDEVALALPGEDAGSAAAVVQWLLSQFADGRRAEGGPPVTTSVGIAASPGDGTVVDALRRLAERRLLLAKLSPGGLVVAG